VWQSTCIMADEQLLIGSLRKQGMPSVTNQLLHF